MRLTPPLRKSLLLLLTAVGCSSPQGPARDAMSPTDLTALDLLLDRPSDRPVSADEARLPDASLWADLAADRLYQDIEHLQDQALKTALLNLVKGHTALSYNAARAAIFIVKDGGIDVHDGKVECVYTGRIVTADGTTAPGGFNVEHSWPQSEGADKPPAESDLHHLFPTDANANSRRGSMPFGDTSCGTAGSGPCKWQEGGSSIGPSVASGATVFQVRPENRGDIARAHFYFAVRYQLGIPAEEEQALRGWNATDLPDRLERNRNEAIQLLQQKPNPFVERPDFVNQISDF